MTVNEISLFVLAAVILIVGLYIDSHRKRKHRRTEPAKKAPAYERDNGPLTAKQLRAIKKLVPQGRMKKIKSSLF